MSILEKEEEIILSYRIGNKVKRFNEFKKKIQRDIRIYKLLGKQITELRKKQREQNHIEVTEEEVKPQ